MTSRRTSGTGSTTTRGWDGLVAWGPGQVLAKLGGDHHHDVRLVELDGRRRVARLGTHGDAALEWELDLLEQLHAAGVNVARPIRTADGRRRVGPLVVFEEVEGPPPTTRRDWDDVASALRWLHRITADWPQRPGRRTSVELARGGTSDDLTATPLPPRILDRCRGAWGRLDERDLAVVLGEVRADVIRMTPRGPVFLDWTGARVDDPALDLAGLPEDASPLDRRRRWSASQALAAWTVARSWSVDLGHARQALDTIRWP
ncbi:phosphotransferase [Actinomarinicola tropica]|uniref:Aminoglycoside phosphotransferase n=1 Tax=Actinomarinicola tropica TaxID=2789776 RepID=A0A5Q2RMZ5_9ACTN|nr:phosphotransferase [Actinomarinicola tropica]QGG95951.1 aminoglycoside phosphotransferase [Actinomarinicola tropica]